MSELARLLVNKVERTDYTTSAAVLRRAAYATLQAAGVDVVRLVVEERAKILDERQRAWEASVRRLERMRALAASVPQLRLKVQAGPAKRVTELLAKAVADAADRRDIDADFKAAHGIATEVDEWKSDLPAIIAEVALAANVTPAYVRDVRELNRAIAARDKLKGSGDKPVKEHRKRLDRARAWAEPTKERVRHAGDKPVEGAPVGDAKPRWFLWPVDSIRATLDPPAYAAAERLRDLYDGMQPASKVANLDASGGGDPSKKLAVTPHQEACARDYHEIWRRVPGAAVRFLIRNFVLEEKRPGREAIMTFVEFGQTYGQAGPNNEKQARGDAQGALRTALDVLAWASKDYDGWVKAQRRLVFRILVDPDVAALLGKAAATDGETGAAYAAEAVALVLPRTNVKPWIVRSCIRRAVNAVRREMANQREEQARAHQGSAA